MTIPVPCPAHPVGDGPPAGTSYDELRAAVRALLAEGRRTRFAPRVHAGRPGGTTHSVEATPYDDQALRADVLTVMVEALGATVPPLVWVTRPGGAGAPEVADLDLSWLRATRAASGELGLPLAFAVVTRHGWWDPLGGQSRTWRRLR
ncbi:hypothetical protein INN71_07615 [Nocardioides sp. ChNu-153]|uniref:hypothetical protein n=1 Tax=unclassified Nocardioides TaxID=2615069 RepID=UPI002404E793|nr:MULTISPECIES: hypothetical protein [unclassified Nocardioides]MDF9715586.1 hypothetical protein [Nocardioides sp. ChNu-99]MDN7121258.1 hypothetical protein [Nocardioides sp. ChNu-153]